MFNHARRFLSVAVVAGLGIFSTGVLAGTTVDELRKEVTDLRRRLNDRQAAAAPISRVEGVIGNKYGPDAEVSTRSGKLQISGLLHIWNYSIQDDHQDVFGDRGNFAGTGGTSEAIDNNGYRIRRTELKFSLDIHENITAVIMVDPARQATSFAPLPTNQGLFKSYRENPSIATDFPISQTSVGRVQTGAGAANTMLQDAYINYHGVVPHHDFTLGQFKPPMGEEGTRSSAFLDFAERSMVTQVNDLRDQGLQVHGTWWEDRFQYWGGVFNGAGNLFGTSGQFQNRSDDNDEKDFVGRVLVRPLWNCGAWGSMELGYSGMFGVHGEAGGADAFGAPINGLNRNQNDALRHAAWMMYKPMGPVRGWWIRGEYGYQRDRTAPSSVNVFGLGDGDLGEQTAPDTISRDGFYIATGFKLTDSVFGDRLSKGGFFNNLLQPVEFAFRYEKFGNIIAEDLVNPNTKTDIFQTDVLTVGVNYYVKAYNMRVQVNYMIVNEEENRVNQPNRGFVEVTNNVFIFTYQLSF